MKKLKKIFMNVSLLQMISWLLLIIWDYLSEKLGIGTDMDIVFKFIVIFPILITIGYLMLENKICNKMQISKKRLCTYVIATWLLETIIVTIIVWALIGNNKWIIYQETNGWDNFLNGIEYVLVPFYNAVSPCIIILFQRIINFIYKKLKIRDWIHRKK